MGFQDRYKEMNVETYPGNSAITSLVNSAKMFHVNNAKMFPDSSAEMFLSSNVKMSPDSNVEMFHDKYVHKLVMAVNFLSHSTKENMEQTSVDITSPISIILQLSYVIFIFTSSFGLKNNLVY